MTIAIASLFTIVFVCTLLEAITASDPHKEMDRPIDSVRIRIASLLNMELKQPIMSEYIDQEIQRRMLFVGKTKVELKTIIDAMLQREVHREILLEEHREGWILRVLVSSYAPDKRYVDIVTGDIVFGFDIEQRVRKVRYSEGQMRKHLKQ